MNSTLREFLIITICLFLKIRPSTRYQKSHRNKNQPNKNQSIKLHDFASFQLRQDVTPKKQSIQRCECQNMPIFCITATGPCFQKLPWTSGCNWNLSPNYIHKIKYFSELSSIWKNNYALFLQWQKCKFLRAEEYGVVDTSDWDKK